MMDQADRVQAALRTTFPTLGIVVDERDRGHKLRCTVTVNDTRSAFFTPETVSAKNEAPEYWIHRFTLLLREHYKL